jgi:hypothetical protein
MVLSACFTACSKATEPQTQEPAPDPAPKAAEDLLPGDHGVPGWTLDGAPDKIESDSALRADMNGAAYTYYFGYGFTRAVYQVYSDSLNQVELQVFDLSRTDSAAASYQVFLSESDSMPVPNSNFAYTQAFYQEYLFNSSMTYHRDCFVVHVNISGKDSVHQAAGRAFVLFVDSQFQ